MKIIFSVLLVLFHFCYIYAQVENTPIKECTILMPPIEERTVFCAGCQYWPNGRVPYKFHNNVTTAQRNAMLSAMAIWEAVANIDFVKKSSADPNYILIQDGDGNNSALGMSGGQQIINIYNWNWTYIMCHELAHALGFYHEQSRPDRDSYVIVLDGTNGNIDNVCNDGNGQFNPENTGITPNIPYDYSSIMHYSKDAFVGCSDNPDLCYPDNGCESAGLTIQTIDINFQDSIGNRDYLSYSDALMMSFVYPYSNYRFVNKSIVNSANTATHIYNALNDFTTTINSLTSIPDNSDVWIMPGDYIGAEGTYSKPMTLKAPYSGVVLR